MSDAELTVLVVDDDFRVANLHAGVVNTLPGFTVSATVNTLAGARKAEAVDLALVDVYLPDGSGIDFVRELQGDSMVLTAATEPVTIRAAWVNTPASLIPILFDKDGQAQHQGKSYRFEPVYYANSPTQITAIASGELEIATLNFISI